MTQSCQSLFLTAMFNHEQMVQTVFKDAIGTLKIHGPTGSLPKPTILDKTWDGEPRCEICHGSFTGEQKLILSLFSKTSWEFPFSTKPRKT